MDTGGNTCELTPQYTGSANEKYKDYWPKWYNPDKIDRNVVNQKLDDVAGEFYHRKLLNMDTEGQSCELTPKFVRSADETYKDYWPKWYNPDIIAPDVVAQKLDHLAKEFEKRKMFQYYIEDLQFDYKTAKEELMKGYESHNFGGTVVCGDGSEISKTKARVELVDYNLPEPSRMCYPLHDKARYPRKSASFDFPAFIGKNDFSLVKYRFYDVCYDGQLIEVNAYVDGIGQFGL
uniref:Uncharacterized protein n=2 Tax=Panagrolaimus sp. PS1159 TaxID=55785 RepID=A0AC35G1Z7_9BILA